MKIPQIYLEERINHKIKIVNIDKEMKIKLLLDTNNKNNKIISIKNELNLGWARKRKTLKGTQKQTQKERNKKNDKVYRSDSMIKYIILIYFIQQKVLSFKKLIFLLKLFLVNII